MNSGAAEITPEEHRRLREAAAPERSPELEARRLRFVGELALDDEAAELLTRETATADFFEAAITAGAPAARAASWVINELPRQIGDRTVAGLPFGGDAFGKLVAMVEDGTLAGPAAREVLAEMVETGEAPGAIVDRRGLRAIADEGALGPVVERIVAAHADKAEEYRAGRTGLMGFFMGQVMRETGGKADPEVARRVLGAVLDRE